MTTLGNLTVLPSISAWVAPDGRVTIGRKFLDGMAAYLRRWDGPVTVCLPSGPNYRGMDDESIDPASLDFRLVIDGDLRELIRGSAVVLASAGREQSHVAALCKHAGVPCVYVTEYTLKTRLQIVASNTSNPLLRARRAFWEWRTERFMQRALREAAGAQCNGTPTYESYKKINSNPLLFFDTRSSANAMATDAELDERIAEMMRGGPLRLAFSGRLVPMKGADDLLKVARALHARNFDFKMSICGDGELAETMKKEVGSLPVEMLGVLDFESELQPLLKRSCDLFVCCHRQGDPSCTYLETMSVGVPIIGYDNEAFVGVNKVSGFSDWVVPMNQPEVLAERIASLEREKIAEASRRALAFARQHSFEAVFDQRIDHLRRLAGPVKAGR